MSIDVRPMKPEEAEAVAKMVHGLAVHIGTDFVPALTGEKLRAAADLIDVVVADDGGRLIGACLGLMTFSTWRGAPGLYVVDLFVLPEATFAPRWSRNSLKGSATAWPRATKRCATFSLSRRTSSNAISLLSPTLLCPGARSLPATSSLQTNGSPMLF